LIRDTFETNPGLCELFKRKILERARFVGLSEDLIDFETRIDPNGTYHDNLRVFYREYPQLSQNSDYLRIKSTRALSGAALDQSWRGYERNNGHELPEPTRILSHHSLRPHEIMPELAVTYTFGAESIMPRQEPPKKPELVSIETMLRRAEDDPAVSTYGELLRSILDCVTSMAGERVTKAILHQIEADIGGTAINVNQPRRSLVRGGGQ
jgi:hypothetical protein